jgi:hypothetical protein
MLSVVKESAGRETLEQGIYCEMRHYYVHLLSPLIGDVRIIGTSLISLQMEMSS